nr:hypothetical protein [Burkholderiales bacterium]
MKHKIIFFASLLILGGCATSPSVSNFQEGKKLIASGEIEQGLEQIEKASRREPGNIEYKGYLASQRAAAVDKLTGKAVLERNEGNFDAAESDYRVILRIDPANQHAKDGIERLKADRRHKDEVAQAQSLFDKGDIQGANSMLSTVLSEDPDQKDGKVLKKRIDEIAAKAMKKPELDLAYGKKITLEFQDASLKSVFD